MGISCMFAGNLDTRVILLIIVCLANCTAFQAIRLVQIQFGPCNFLPSCMGYKPIRFFKFAISANQVAWIDVTWQKFSICENCIATFHSYISKNRYYNNWRQLNQDRAGHYKFIEFLAGKEQFLVMMRSLMFCIYEARGGWGSWRFWGRHTIIS